MSDGRRCWSRGQRAGYPRSGVLDRMTHQGFAIIHPAAIGYRRDLWAKQSGLMRSRAVRTFDEIEVVRVLGSRALE